MWVVEAVINDVMVFRIRFAPFSHIGCIKFIGDRLAMRFPKQYSIYWSGEITDQTIITINDKLFSI